MRLRHYPAAPPVSPLYRSAAASAVVRQEPRARLTEVMSRAQTRAVKASLRCAERERIVGLCRMLERVRHEHAAAVHSPEKAVHLTDAILDLETLIVRECLRAVRR